MLLPSTAGGRASLLGRIFRVVERERRTFAPELPPRKRHRTVGLLRLRLHPEAGGETARLRKIISPKSASARSTISAAVAPKAFRVSAAICFKEQATRPPIRRSDESVPWRIGRARPVASLPRQTQFSQ